MKKMDYIIEDVNGGVLVPIGYKTCSGCAGSKKNKPDLGILFCESDATIAGTFTKNEILAHSVVWSKKIVETGHGRALVVTSGNANCCNGEIGERNNKEIAELTSAELGIRPNEVLMAATGVIGRKLPMNIIKKKIGPIIKKIDSGWQSGHNFAKAIMTTDTRPKERAVKVRKGIEQFAIGGTAKGVGMIAPNMATMLSFITTDAAVEPKLLQYFLNKATNNSFNKITVDGHVSTNDMLIIFANGRSGVSIEKNSRNSKVFYEALERVTIALATDLVRDGEGATRFVTIKVAGCKNPSSAKKVAYAIANSPLVKTAIYGSDPNWGRIISAAGYAGIPMQIERTSLFLNDIPVFKNGESCNVQQKLLKKIFSDKDITISIDLGNGKSDVKVWTCDMSHEYITINADYTT